MEEKNIRSTLNRPNEIKEAKSQSCSFCYAQSFQIKALLRSAFISLKKMLIKRGNHSKKEGVEREGQESIQRLIRVLFQREQFQMKISKYCQHNQLLNMFANRMKCSLPTLDFLIDQLCDSIAKRNYQLEVIGLQIKNVENSVFELKDREQLIENARKSTSESAQSKEVKVEQEVMKNYEPSPITSGMNYNISFDSLPFSYNILFYGNGYYQ